MTPILEQARTHLHALGLRAEEYSPSCLNIWATETPFVGGLTRTPDLSRLYAEGERLTVLFPGPGQCRYAMSGEPAEILPLITTVYRLYLEKGGTVSKAVEEQVPDAERFVIGRPS